MAVSGKTASPLEIPYALSTDKPPDAPLLSKTQAERLHVLLEERDAEIQRGGVAGHVFAAEVTRANAAFGSFSTPLKVTLPKVLAGQIVEFYAVGFMNGGVTCRLACGPITGPELSGEEVAGTRRPFITSEAGLVRGSANSPVKDFRDKVLSGEGEMGMPIGLARFLNKEDRTNFVLEIEGKGLSANVKDAYLMARVVG